MARIAENVHRRELSEIERGELIAEWVRLTKDRKDKVRQAAAPSGGRQPSDKGLRKAAKELGIPERSVRRAVRVASLSPAAKAEARSLAGGCVEIGQIDSIQYRVGGGR